MTQAQLNRAIARATGEDVQVIAAQGFTLLDDDVTPSEDDLAGQTIDWEHQYPTD